MTAKYKVIRETKKGKEQWMVVTKENKPCHKEPHKTLAAAERHCKALLAFFG